VPKHEDTSVIDELVDDLRSRIEQGLYGTSGTLPTTELLATQWKKPRSMVTQVMSILQAEGKIRLVGNRYVVSYPHLVFPGLVKDFGKYLEEQGFTPVMENLIEPREEQMPPDIAALFHQEAGIHVVRRVRKQSLRKEGIPDCPLRIAENWYPSHLALPFLEEMRANDYIHVVEAIKEKFGVTIVQHEERISGRIPTRQEREWLSISRYQPVLELVWNNFDKDDQPVMFNRIVMVASNFEITHKYAIDLWN